MVEQSTAAFTSLADLASARVGGRALAANDEFFAAKSNLLKPEPPIFVPGKFTSRGKWMDGWESRRRRTPGHDWCVVALGMRGIIHGVNVDTTHFTGNYPSHCSIDVLDTPAAVGASVYGVEGRPWTTLLRKSALRGNGENFFAIDDARPWTHLRLNIFPDGGVARLRVYGEVSVDWRGITRAGRAIDLASIKNGGLVLGASDMHFGARDNMIMPGRATNMGDGWETRRRREPGHDWAVLELGTFGRIEEVVVDTAHFKGNYPDRCSIQAADVTGGTDESLITQSMFWRTLLPEQKLEMDRPHTFQKEVADLGAISHVRLNIIPDGGISRLRLWGELV
jgi:allantoicase